MKRKRTYRKSVSKTVAELTGRTFRAMIIALICLWIAVNVRIEYDGARIAKQAETVGKTWVGKTMDGVSNAIKIVKAVN